MARVHIAFGGNLGEVEQNLRHALRAVARLDATRIVRLSSLYRTAPVGVADQPDFINGVAELDTSLEPLELLRQLLRIEDSLGRTRATRWGPRTVDLDLVLWADRMVQTAELVVPHPRMHERRFVLAPLAEIAPDAVHPQSGKRVRELLKELDPTPDVTPLGRPAWLAALEEAAR